MSAPNPFQAACTGAAPLVPGVPTEALRLAGLLVDEAEARAADEANRRPVEPTTRYVRFYISEQSYAIPVLRILEVLKLTEIASVPGAPMQVLGVVNLRGRIVPVISLRRLLELPDAAMTEADAEHERLVVIESGREAVALLVDSVAGLINVAASAIEKPPRVGSRAVPIAGVMTDAEEVLVFLDVDALMHMDQTGATDA